MKKVFVNGKIYTADKNNSFVEAILIEGNTIKSVGSTAEISSFIDNETDVINLDGKLMLPGFIDAHMHFMWGSFSLNEIDLSKVTSVDQFADRIQSYVTDTLHSGYINEKGNNIWIKGGRWDNTKWDKKDLPSKQLVDNISGEIPLFLERIDLHMALVNSSALKAAGIDKDTPNPDGGIIEKDLNGELTGILKDNAIMLIKNILPSPTEQEKYSAALKGLQHLKEFGITGIHDITNAGELSLYKKLEDEGNLTCRIYSIYPILRYKEIISSPMNSGKLKTGALKAFTDGSLGSGTAWFFDDYSDEPGNKGIATDVVLNGSLEEAAYEGAKAGLQLCINAIGDKANHYVLSLYDNLINRFHLPAHRHRVEHAQHLRDEDIPRFNELNVLASVQPYHLADDAIWAEKRIGAKRKKFTYAFNSLQKSGARLVMGSDWTVAPVNPLLGIWAAVTRNTVDGKYPEGWVSEERISVEDAVKGYTINNAYASFDEDVKGSIEPGKLADLVILDRDIFTIPPEEIKTAKVVNTIFDGSFIS